MDLQGIEEAMKRLEPEIEKVAAIGQLRTELDALRLRMDEAILSLGQTETHLAESSDSVRGSMALLKEQLGQMDQRLAQLARDIDERVAIQLSSTTNRFEGFVREESRAISDRLELNQRELAQRVEKVETSLRDHVDAAMVALESAQKRRFRVLLWVAIAIVILVPFMDYLSRQV